jgi:hypothetical protein
LENLTFSFFDPFGYVTPNLEDFLCNGRFFTQADLETGNQWLQMGSPWSILQYLEGLFRIAPGS